MHAAVSRVRTFRPSASCLSFENGTTSELPSFGSTDSITPHPIGASQLERRAYLQNHVKRLYAAAANEYANSEAHQILTVQIADYEKRLKSYSHKVKKRIVHSKPKPTSPHSRLNDEYEGFEQRIGLREILSNLRESLGRADTIRALQASIDNARARNSLLGE